MTDEGAGTLHLFGAATLAPPRVISSLSFSSPVTTRLTETGSHVIEGLRVFKAGTFADSMGVVRTWTTDDLDKMVGNFNLLKDRNIFPNVPVRADHTDSVKDVVGYFQRVYRDVQDSNFLASDIEITEPDAFMKWERGTFRSRSLEVGMYKTNGDNPQEFFPVVFGLAFVDIGAVEGLFSKENDSPFRFSQVVEDSPKPEENTVTHEEFVRACAYAQWEASANYAQACQDWERAVAYAAALESHTAQATELGLTPTAHNQNTGAITFAAGGRMVTMTPQEIGTSLSTLMEFQRETIVTGRQSFVDELVKDHKIAAPQADDMKALVVGLDDKQFESFKKGYEKAPVAALFGQFGQQEEGGPAAQTLDDQIEIFEGIVANHRRTGKTDAEIEKLDSYKKLTTLKASKGQG